jgi:GNAT superfamily N-acetyltransferase
MTLQDIERGLELCRSAGWNQVQEDWEYFIDHGKCTVAVVNDRVVGTCAALAPEGPVAWIAMMLVDPDFRRQAIGRQLFEAVLELCAASPCIGLDATVAGARLYSQYGFAGAFEIVRWHRPAGPAVAESPAAPFRKGHFANQIGPVTSASVNEAAAMVLGALAADPNRAWILDAPDRCAQWNAWLAAQGFTPGRRFLRMYRGTPPPPDSNLYATAGPEYGPFPPSAFTNAENN